MQILKKYYTLFKEKLNTSDIATRMATGAFWSFTGTAVAKMLVLIAGILCARILTQQEYGEYNMVRSTINLFVVFGVAGIGLTATKYISEYKAERQERICSIYLLTNGFAIISGLIVTVVLLLLAPSLAENTLKSPHLTKDIRIGALLLFVTILNGAQNGTLSGFENFKAIALNTLYGSIAETVLMLVGAYFWGVSGAILGFGSGFVVLYTCNAIAIRKQFRRLNIHIHKSSFDKNDLQLLYRFSLPAALSSFLVGPTFWIIRTLLVRENGFNELAIYEAADQWKIIILFIPSAISQIVLPILSSTANTDHKKYWKIIKINLALNAGITIIIAMIVALCSGFIMRFYGEGYNDFSVLMILAFSTVFTSIASIVGISISSRAKMWIGFSFNLLWAIMTIGFSYIYVCMYDMGATGMALAILCAYIIHSSLQLIYLKNMRLKTGT